MWASKQVIILSKRRRVQQWERNAREQKQLQRKENADIIMNSTQSASRCTLMSNCPTLLRRSSLWSMQRQRFLCAKEAFEVQGLPIFGEGGQCDESSGDERRYTGPYACPFVKLVLPDTATARALSDTECFSLTGNGMSLQCVGPMLGFILACTIQLEGSASG